MDRARKRLVSAIDGIRAQFTDADSQEDADLNFPGTAASRCQQQQQFMFREKIEAAHCRLAQIVRHGFPDGPKCMAWDPVQKLCAIGASRGCVRLLGQAGVDHLLKHESDEPVMHVQFLVNEGGLVTVLQDDTIHLWNYRQRIPEVVHSLRMSKERVTAIHLPFQSKWLMVGTDKGNVYFLSLGTFELSTQIIYWNKAVDMTCRTHPGSIRSLESCPIEPGKMLILFAQGHVVLWNMLTKEAERFTAAMEQSPVTAVSWHSDGRQFMCGHSDGTLSIWNLKKPHECVHRSAPHSTISPSLSSSSPSRENNPSLPPTLCKPISQVSWNTNAEGEQLIVFTGGMPTDEGALPSLTVLRAKGSMTVLEMDHAIVSMLPLNTSPYASVPQHPPAIAVLLRNDLLVVDMQAQGYPCFEVPHPMDLHESPVTILRYYSDCPVEMIGSLTLVGRNQRRQGVRLSNKQWPISGGVGRECATGHQEMLLTGHEDGSIKFWQASSEQLQVMYKLKTGRHFEKSLTIVGGHHANNEEKPAPLSHAVVGIELCVDSRLLLVSSGSGQVSLFRFAKTECCQEIAIIPLPQLCRSTQSLVSPPSCPPSPSYKEEDQAIQQQQATVPSQQKYRLKQQSRSSGGSNGGGGGGSVHQHKGELKRQGQATEPPQASRNSSHSTDTASYGSQQLTELAPLKVRGGALRRPAGYQPELVCQIPWVNGVRPEPVTALALNSAYGLMACGTAAGLALIDLQTATLVYAWSNSELLGRDLIPFWTSMASQETTVTSPTLLEHQFSTQTPPVQPPKSPGPLYRGNTTDSVAAQDNRLLGLSSSRFQRPQLIKALTFNPTNPSGGGKEDGQQPEVSQKSTPMAMTAECPPPNVAAAQNGNGDLSIESRHCSSSDSLEKIGVGGANGHPQNANAAGTDEFVCSLQFINCPATRGDGVSNNNPCLWLGTSHGASLAFQVQLPVNRTMASVVVAPSGAIIRLAGRILAISFLDRNGLLAGPSENFKNIQQEQVLAATSSSKESSSAAQSTGLLEGGRNHGEGEEGGKEGESQKPNKMLTKASQSPVLSAAASAENPAFIPEEEILQMAFFVAESEVRAIGLPTYRQLFHRQFIAQSAEEIPLVRANITHVGGHPALVALNAAGALIVLSFPSLRTLMYDKLFPHSVDIDDRICDRYYMSEHGLGMYMISPSETQKFTINAEIATQVAECMGELFVPCDMPEPPKQQSFLRGVMSTLAAAAGAGTLSASEQLTEMDLFLSEKPTSSTAVSQIRTVARPLLAQQQKQLGGIELGASRTVTAGQATREAMQNLAERSERLNAVTDATEQLRNNAVNIQNRSAKLLEKYEKKKWYQL